MILGYIILTYSPKIYSNNFFKVFFSFLKTKLVGSIMNYSSMVLDRNLNDILPSSFNLAVIESILLWIIYTSTGDSSGSTLKLKWDSTNFWTLSKTCSLQSKLFLNPSKKLSVKKKYSSSLLFLKENHLSILMIILLMTLTIILFASAYGSYSNEIS